MSDTKFNPNQEKITRWYKEPLAWLLFGIPFLAIIWGSVMLTLALKGKDTLVSDSYYKDGVSYTENRELDDKAARLQIKANLVATNEQIRASVQGYLDNMPDHLVLQLIHPTLEERDMTIMLQQTEPGIFVAALEMELPSRRHIWLYSNEQQWRVRKTDTLQDSQVIQLIAE
ncbi:MAG: FixH family protein [Oceanobacter sp.]